MSDKSMKAKADAPAVPFPNKFELSAGIKAFARGLEEKYGPNAFTFGSATKRIERISTGLPKLDAILGGGWPRSRISEVWGPDKVGKSTLVAYTVRELQKNPDARILYVDAENSYDDAWWRSLGVDTGRMMRAGAMAGEDIIRLVQKVIRENWDLVIIDSVVGLLPMKELEQDPEAESYAPLARFLARNIPKIVIMQGMSDTAVIVTNQVRDRVGFVLGSSEKAPGGRTLAHADSLRLKLQRKEGIEGKGGKKIGYHLAIKVIRSRISNEGAECILDFIYGKGLQI